MFVDAALAARIDAVEARLSAAVARHVAGSTVVELGIGRGVVVRAGSPMNKIIGAGFTGPIDEAALAKAEAAFTVHGEAPRIELATLVAPDVLDAVTQRGYRLVGIENVLVRALTATLPLARPPGIDVRTGDEATWKRVIVDGFAAPDGTGAVVDEHSRDTLEQIMADYNRTAGLVRYLAYVEGEPAGAATMRVDDGIALLAGATTLPAYRRRGVQAGLLAARLADAHAAGCELAVVTTAPGSQSQANVMRSGFALGYARAILLGVDLGQAAARAPTL